MGVFNFLSRQFCCRALFLLKVENYLKLAVKNTICFFGVKRHPLIFPNHSGVNPYQQYRAACLPFAEQISYGLRKIFDEDLFLRAKDVILNNLLFAISSLEPSVVLQEKPLLF